MCRLRLITKSQDNTIVSDKDIALDHVEISALDRPSYAIYYQDQKRVEFFYPRNTEGFLEKDITDSPISFTYGKLSGRIFTVKIRRFGLNDTEKFNMARDITYNKGNQRFKDNIRMFLNLIQQLLKGIKTQ